jgi:hypothetical protein
MSFSVMCADLRLTLPEIFQLVGAYPFNSPRNTFNFEDVKRRIHVMFAQVVPMPIDEEHKQACRCMQHMFEVSFRKVLVSIVFHELVFLPPFRIQIFAPRVPRKQHQPHRTNRNLNAREMGVFKLQGLTVIIHIRPAGERRADPLAKKFGYDVDL